MSDVINDELFKIWSSSVNDDERDAAIGLILEYLKLKIVRTNQTKHGTVELKLLPDDI